MYKLFTDILVTKGFTRDLYIDIRKGNVKLMPREITELVSTFDIEDKNYSAEEMEIINELIKSEFVFEITSYEVDFFPKYNLEWNNSSNVTNGIIVLSKKNIDSIQNIFEYYEKQQCYFFSIVLFDNFTVSDYSKIIYYLDSVSIISYELIINYFENSGIETFLNEIIERNRQIKYPVVYNCKNSDVIKRFDKYIIFKQGSFNSKLCGCIKKDNFNANMYLYTESQHHNTCLNRKISIDENGEIKNCPSMKESFGNIKDTTLEEALSKPEFKKYWDIKKDDIAVCKDCEFRHICTDCRAYLENPEDVYSKPLKCGYNPYTNEWADWSTNPLKQKAMDYYGMRDILTDKNA